MLHNNFNNGARCLTVNGWFVIVQKNDGSRKVGDREITWKKGDVSHSYVPITNQMIVMEQFDQSPVLLFTTRYNEVFPNGGNRWVSVTQSLSKINGLLIADSRPPNFNGFSPMFSNLRIDMKARTVSLVGFGGSIQFYVDEGKGPPPIQGAQLNPMVDGTNVAISPPGNPGNGPVFGPILANPLNRQNGRAPRIVQPMPAIEVPPPAK